MDARLERRFMDYGGQKVVEKGAECRRVEVIVKEAKLVLGYSAEKVSCLKTDFVRSTIFIMCIYFCQCL